MVTELYLNRSGISLQFKKNILFKSASLSLSLSLFFLVSRFGHRLNVSDLYKLTDTVAIREQGNGRLVCLLPSSQARQSPLGSSQSHDGSSTNCSPIIFEELEYHEPVCRQHCPNKDFRYVAHFFEKQSFCKRLWSIC